MSRRALIVDDSNLARLMVKKIISMVRPDWKLVMAKDGDEALSIALGSTFDVMFIDFNMPKLDGIQLVEKLRENNIYAPAALVTANIQSSIQNKAEDLNIGFVGKPATEEKISHFLKVIGL